MSNLQKSWDEFLSTWPPGRVKNMSLAEYVAVGDKTTFTYWLETKTLSIANIKGSSSAKFGIYKRSSAPKEKAGITHGREYSWQSRFGASEQEAFTTIRNTISDVIDAAQKGDLATIEECVLAPLFKWKIAFLYQEQSSPKIVNIFSTDKLIDLTSIMGKSSYSEYYSALMRDYSAERYVNVAEYGKHCWQTLETDARDTLGTNLQVNKMNHASVPLNQILYGPPGTGKTYYAVEAAVSAANPEFNENFDKDRVELKEEYDRLVQEKRIRFVTFHQSYGYEEFVEGLKARETDAGDVTYVTENGVFKNICDEAASNDVVTNSDINLNGTVWKLSIEGTNSNPTKTYCFNNDLAAIGWGDTGNLSADTRNEYFQSLGRNDQNTLNYFSDAMAIGDLVLCIDSNTSIEAIGVVSSDYQYKGSGLTTRNDYCHQRFVKWLAKGFSVDFKAINGNKQFNLPTCYPLHRLSISEVIQHLSKHDVSVLPEKVNANKDNYVLIIDEINRGNISKIFGELITLIEPSKRSGNGNTEALTLSLPHSGKPFSVPSNLYIIGTMNTADRSLAMMDTALRRRFDFVEMMPAYEALEGIEVVHAYCSINLSLMLKAMNQRIEVLYDREHTLGHAFLMPVKSLVEKGLHEGAFNELVSVFRNKLIPLLEEYFFEDWNKIHLVLGDNRKLGKENPYIFVKQQEDTYNSIFGSNHGLETYEDKKITYCLADNFDKNSAWWQPLAYKAIYDHTCLPTLKVKSEIETPSSE
jgi:5-methylcytosine-specific restriction protein B